MYSISVPSSESKMSAFSSPFKRNHVSPSASSREHTCDSVGLILGQAGCLTHDQGQDSGTELGLMEMTEIEYTHLQQLIQAHTAAQAGPPDGPDARTHPGTATVKDVTGSTVISSFMTGQAIDLSTSTDEHCQAMPGEKTPISYGEVPGFVLARISGEDSPTKPPANSSTPSQRRARSAARVCLEKRFNALPADSAKQKDIQSAVLSK